MNKHQRAEIKKIIVAQIPSVTEDLRLQRLNTALARIDIDNFGQCFTCEENIPFGTLETSPERVICDNCLKGPKV